ncbi:MAG: efflux RND transporter periplasmic adaptor subunit [Nitrospirae bacterium]|nr:efflux RND transporter periplasmic adaptor subunit [Nitrospirota bacterium]
MNKKNLPIIAGLILISGLLLYFYKAGYGEKLFKSKASEAPAVTAQPSSEHQAHGGGPQTPSKADKEETSAETPTVEISDDSQKLIGVKVTEAAVKPFVKIIRTVGRIEYDERKISTVTMKFEGWIEKLHIDYTGRLVKKGEPLAEIYSPELVATQQELINVTKWKKQGGEVKDKNLGGMLIRDSETLVEAAKQRLRLFDISDAQIKNIEETGRPFRTLTLYSPASGYVLQKTALQGMRAMPGDRLFDIADLGSVWVIADVYEHDLPFVREGHSANIGLSYFPGKEFKAKVDYVYPALAGETRTAKIRFTLPNPGGVLKPQMFTNVELKVDLGKRLAVPEEAVIDTGLRQVVYVDKGEGNFEPREVTTGVRADGLVEITKGLKSGEKVASAANFLIDSEAQLKGVKPLKLKP